MNYFRSPLENDLFSVICVLKTNMTIPNCGVVVGVTLGSLGFWGFNSRKQDFTGGTLRIGEQNDFIVYNRCTTDFRTTKT